MKKILIGVLMATSAAFLFPSCVKVNINEGNQVIDSTGNSTSNIITGIYTTSKYFSKGTYILKGYVYVTDGATMTFEAGSVIKSDVDNKGALIIERGAKLIADGKKDAPIVFTSGKAVGQRAPGDWGGIILLGKAPTNRPLDPAPTIEGGVGRQYGGTDPNDDSGILRYVRIEFAGIAAEPGSEINGLSLGAVGSGTTLDHIQVSFGNDDAYEFFGGTVNGKYLIALATADDDFDFDFGYTGKLQYGFSCRKPDFVDAGDAGNGVECDNDGSGSSAMPYTHPYMSNFTLVGPNDAPGTAANHNLANRWRRATNFTIRNSILLGYQKGGFSMESDETVTSYKNGSSEFKDNLVYAVANPYISKSSLMTNAQVQAKAESEGCITYSKADDIMLNNPFYSTSPNPLPATGSPALSGANYAGMNTFFTTGDYRGAFGATNWLETWTNFDPQNTDY